MHNQMVPKKRARRSYMISLFLRAIVRPLLPIIHRVYTIALGVKSPGESSSLICVELRRHKGQAMKLSDGCEVRPGDLVIKLHLNNDWIAEKRESSAGLKTTDLPRGVIRCFTEGFRLLAAQVANGKYGEVVAVYGWTVLHTGARRLGFQVIDLPNTLRTKLARFYIGGLMRFYHVRGPERYKPSRESLKIKAVWLSKAELLRLYHSC
jgi:peptidoglycan-N-acetylglucosamine deacetylase